MEHQSSPADVAQTVKRMFWLAWQAVGQTFGMGALQDNPNANEEAVWDCVANRLDYSGIGGGLKKDRDGKYEAYGDYVFGRMMKMRVKWTDDGVIDTSDNELRVDYEAWCMDYPTYKALYDAAVESLE